MDLVEENGNSVRSVVWFLDVMRAVKLVLSYFQFAGTRMYCNFWAMGHNLVSKTVRLQANALASNVF